MKDEDLKSAPGEIVHIPTVLGAVVITYNLAGVSQPLRFSPEVIADIFLGKIKKWNDPKIASENPGVTLPDLAITTVHRSDGSGTTGVFTDYLSKISPDWKTKVGSATTVNWPGGVGGNGNAGVAGAVKNTPGAIGYVELIYAIQNKISYGTVKNAAGTYVEANLDSTTKAADGFQVPDLGNTQSQQAKLSITNAAGPDAWPISTFTFLLLPKDFSDKAKGLAALRFAWYGTHEGQSFTKDLGYAPLPAAVQKAAEDVLKAITSGGSKILK